MAARSALATVETLPEGFGVLIGRMAEGDQSSLAALYDATATTVHALAVHEPIPSDEGALLFIVESP